MKRTLLGKALPLAALVLAGCEGDVKFDFRPAPETGDLKPVASAAELEDSIKKGFTTIRGTTATQALTAGAPEGNAAVGDFTGTYTQEQNVDEFDAVRYDGSHLYVAPRRYLNCCFILEDADGAVDTGSDPGDSIRILATNPVDGTASVEGSIPLDEGVSVQGMYLADDRMFALTAESYYGGFGGFWSDIAIWHPEHLGYASYDVSNPAEPRLEVEVSIEGVFVDSRRVNDTVYIISRYTPQVEGIVMNVTTPEEQAHNEALLADVSLEELLPKVWVDGNEQSLVNPLSCFIPNDDEAGYPVITSVTAVPIDNPTSFTTTCYNEETYGAYVSENAIYFTNISGGTSGEDTKTSIHKFRLDGMNIDYRGSADIDGQVWRGGQSDFRMSENGGDLRVIASTYDWGNSDFADHKLFVLREASGRRELDIVGELPSAERPTPIGKPNEDLYGVRFLGDKAYAVTFERIDPLYVIDLSDPTDPLIAGELVVEGFSDFLHPVSGDLLLGLGGTTGGAIKLELFDVSDIAQPLSRGAVTLGNRSFSEARYDRHAFTYQADVEGVDRFAIPATIEREVGAGGPWETGLYLFEIHDKATPGLSRLLEAGSVHPPEDPAYFYTGRNRAFIHDDTIFYVRGEGVWGSFWDAPQVVNGPF